MPKQWVGLHFNKVVLCLRWLLVRRVLEILQMVELHWDDRPGFWVLDLKLALHKTKLEPVISVKLRQQVPCLVDKGKLLGVSCKHDFLDVTGEELLLLCLAETVEEDVVYGTFLTPDDGLLAVFVQEHGLVFHVYLLFQFQVLLPEYQDFPFAGNVYIVLRANSAEHFDCLGLAADGGYQVQVIR